MLAALGVLLFAMFVAFVIWPFILEPIVEWYFKGVRFRAGRPLPGEVPQYNAWMRGEISRFR